MPIDPQQNIARADKRHLLTLGKHASDVRRKEHTPSFSASIPPPLFSFPRNSPSRCTGPGSWTSAGLRPGRIGWAEKEASWGALNTAENPPLLLERPKAYLVKGVPTIFRSTPASCSPRRRSSYLAPALSREAHMEGNPFRERAK